MSVLSYVCQISYKCEGFALSYALGVPWCKLKSLKRQKNDYRGPDMFVEEVPVVNFVLEISVANQCILPHIFYFHVSLNLIYNLSESFLNFLL